MGKLDQIVIFTLNEQRYGIPLGVVEMVVRMVAITPLSGGPEFIDGVINVHGKIIPVLNLRCRFGLPGRPGGCGDHSRSAVFDCGGETPGRSDFASGSGGAALAG